MIRKRLWAGLVALCVSVASWGQAVDSCYYSDGRAMVPVEEGAEAQGFFAEHAPDGLLREECDKVYDPNSPCNKDMATITSRASSNCTTWCRSSAPATSSATIRVPTTRGAWSDAFA